MHWYWSEDAPTVVKCRLGLSVGVGREACEHAFVFSIENVHFYIMINLTMYLIVHLHMKYHPKLQLYIFLSSLYLKKNDISATVIEKKHRTIHFQCCSFNNGRLVNKEFQCIHVYITMHDNNSPLCALL